MKKVSAIVIAITLIPFLITSCVPTQKANKKLIPDGEEFFTLLSCFVDPEVITTSGSYLIVSYKTNTPIDTSNIRAVVVIVLKGSTITQRQYSFSLNPEKFRHYLSNSHKLSGSGTIYVYLERGPEDSPEDSRERVSNVLSIYATFDPN